MFLRGAAFTAPDGFTLQRQYSRELGRDLLLSIHFTSACAWKDHL